MNPIKSIYRNGQPIDLAGLMADTATGWSAHNYSTQVDGQEIALRLVRTNHPRYWRLYLKRGGFFAASWTVSR